MTEIRLCEAVYYLKATISLTNKIHDYHITLVPVNVEINH